MQIWKYQKRDGKFNLRYFTLSGYNLISIPNRRQFPNYRGSSLSNRLYLRLIFQLKFGLELQQIIDLDEKNQVLKTNMWLNLQWKDHNLVWDKVNEKE